MMRILAAVLALSVAGSAGAKCLAPGQMPARVTFADGDVMDDIRREGDNLHTTLHLASGLTAYSETIFGLYPMQSSIEGMASVYRWKTKSLPAPQDLPVGKAKKLMAEWLREGGNARFTMTVTLVETGEVKVGSCSYPALHLNVETKDSYGVRSVSDTWFDPDRLIVWTSARKVFNSKGGLEGAFETKAVAAE
ncbi:hypothetical protein [Cypionkella sinensis]|uniref:DUF3108 domain-containing protein n=1 Tax=Cypionkella sinensis TaxID=1756043 RepID=A0ABV7J0Z2_9RHOB